MMADRCTAIACGVLVLLPALAQAKAPITALAFAPDGEQIIVGSQDALQVREWPSLAKVRNLATVLPQAHDVAFSPSGDRLLVGGGSPAEYGGFALYSWPEGEVLHEVVEHDDVVYGVTWAGDGSEFATAAGDETVATWNADDVRRRHTLAGHSRRVLAAAYVPGTELLVSAGADQSLRVWNRTSGELVRTLDNHTDIVRDVAVRQGEQGLAMIASASVDRTVRFWQPTIGRLVRFVRLPAEPLAVAWTPDGSQIAVSCTDGHVRVIDPETLDTLRDKAALDGWAYEVAIAPSGRELSVAGSMGQIRHLELHVPPR